MARRGCRHRTNAGSPDGRAILGPARATTSARLMRLSDRLRAARGTTPTSWPHCSPSSGCGPGLSTSSASSRRHALHRRRARAGLPPRGGGHPRRPVYNASLATVHDLGCGIGSDAVAMSALGVTVQGVDIDPVTAAVADINLRPWPDSRARVGLAEEFEAPRDPLRSRVGVWLDPARRVPGRHRSPRTDQARLPARRDPPDVGVRAAGRDRRAGHRRQAVALDAARRHPARHRGAVDLVRRRGARVRGVVGSAGPAPRAQRPHPAGPNRSPIEVDETMAEPEIPTVESLGAVGPWLYEPDRAVTQAGLLGAVTAATARQRGRHRPRLRRQRRARRRAVRPALRRARGDAVQRARSLRAWLQAARRSPA